MKALSKHLGTWAVLACAAGWSASSAADIVLFDFGLNVDGTTTCASGPCDAYGVSDLGGVAHVNDSAFDYGTGLGMLSVSLTGAGAHYVSLFVDHEMSESVNTFFNENGKASGSPAAGQSWEVDEPGYAFGDIFANFRAGVLDNSNALPVGSEDDVSMALGWSFVLGPDETALIDFVLTHVEPTSGFFLTQSDPDSDESLYFASTSIIRGVSAPEPGSSLLLGAGLLAMGLTRWRRPATSTTHYLSRQRIRAGLWCVRAQSHARDPGFPESR